ncbi:hypothetical protein [Micromonospora sp. NPDC005174]|uniref:hypothetical protein n=1 Tax=Micromonospora sp. NPDC005174 TaxID=3157018 RepID=UPI0033B6B404
MTVVPRRPGTGPARLSAPPAGLLLALVPGQTTDERIRDLAGRIAEGRRANSTT